MPDGSIADFRLSVSIRLLYQNFKSRVLVAPIRKPDNAGCCTKTFFTRSRSSVHTELVAFLQVSATNYRIRILVF